MSGPLHERSVAWAEFSKSDKVRVALVAWFCSKLTNAGLTEVLEAEREITLANAIRETARRLSRFIETDDDLPPGAA